MIKKLIPFFLLLTLALAFAGCAIQNHKSVKQPTLATRKINISKPFNKINVDGNIHLTITVLKKKSRKRLQEIEVMGAKDEIGDLSATVENSTLNLSHSGLFHQKSLAVKIYMRPLNQITRSGNSTVNASNIRGLLNVKSYGEGNLTIHGHNINLTNLYHAGSGNITISNLKSSNLNIHTEGSGSINLLGFAALKSLNFNGDGRLNLYWVDSESLSITAEGEGYIQLAGVTKWLHANVSEAVHLNARYLRANIAYVRTKDRARIDVWARDNLYTFAANKSNIYYFTKPNYLYVSNHRSGTVLAMHNVPSALLSF